MKKIIDYLIVVIFITTVMSCSKNKIELIPGASFDEHRQNAFYQEYNANLGNKTIEGVINIDKFSNRINEEGFPIFELDIKLEIRYFIDDTIEVRESIELPQDYSIAVNIETGYYALKGLPDIEDGYEMLISVNDQFWRLPDHEIYVINMKYNSSEWNGANEAIELPTAWYLPADPSIAATIKFKYMVDDFWLENGEFENGANEGTYTEMSYSELYNIATISVEEYRSGVGISKGNDSEYGVSYGVGSHISLEDCQKQERSFGGFAGGYYWQMDALIIVNNEVYGGYYNFPNGGLFLSSGESYSGTVDIYIPQKNE